MFDSSPSTRPRALVVDDSPTVCAVLRMHLEQAGWQVDAFQDPVAALAHIHEHADSPATVLLLDLVLPKMDGYELLAAIRSSAPDSWRAVPGLAISGNESVSARLKARLGGFAAYLQKPFVVQGLFALLQEQFPHLFEPPPTSESPVPCL